jgi:hypothetical protein
MSGLIQQPDLMPSRDYAMLGMGKSWTGKYKYREIAEKGETINTSAGFRAPHLRFPVPWQD